MQSQEVETGKAVYIFNNWSDPVNIFQVLNCNVFSLGKFYKIFPPVYNLQNSIWKNLTYVP